MPGSDAPSPTRYIQCIFDPIKQISRDLLASCCFDQVPKKKNDLSYDDGRRTMGDSKLCAIISPKFPTHVRLRALFINDTTLDWFDQTPPPWPYLGNPAPFARSSSRSRSLTSMRMSVFITMPSSLPNRSDSSSRWCRPFLFSVLSRFP